MKFLVAFLVLIMGLSQARKPFRFTDETVAKYVDEIFFTYDQNEDQYLDRHEALQFYRDANGLTPSQKTDMNDFGAWVAIIDANNDQKLSWNEVYTLAENAE